MTKVTFLMHHIIFKRWRVFNLPQIIDGHSSVILLPMLKVCARIALQGVTFTVGSTTEIKSIHDLAVVEHTSQLSAVISGTFSISKNLLKR
jgi:hypothetical protein